MKFDPRRFPFGQLLWRSVLWTPIAILLTCILIAAVFATVFMPIYGLVLLWLGDYLPAAGSFLAGFVSYLAARYLTKRFWEPPSSLL